MAITAKAADVKTKFPRAFRQNRRFGPLLLGLASVGALAYNFCASFSLAAFSVGLFGFLAATAWDHFAFRARRVGTRLLLQSIITCPQCGHRTKEKMPPDACLYFYDCPVCGTKLKPKIGDCCVFCSYGSVPCPPVQTKQSPRSNGCPKFLYVPEVLYFVILVWLFFSGPGCSA
jgi:hypothetical protein